MKNTSKKSVPTRNRETTSSSKTTMNGKGSKRRKENIRLFSKNYDKINWARKRPIDTLVEDQRDTPQEFADIISDNFEDLVTDTVVMPKHIVRYNGGERCDMLKGPCSCGAWH